VAYGPQLKNESDHGIIRRQRKGPKKRIEVHVARLKGGRFHSSSSSLSLPPPFLSCVKEGVRIGRGEEARETYVVFGLLSLGTLLIVGGLLDVGLYRRDQQTIKEDGMEWRYLFLRVIEFLPLCT
jgi:hypothetical protein